VAYYRCLVQLYLTDCCDYLSWYTILIIESETNNIKITKALDRAEGNDKIDLSSVKDLTES
jgi:hypothetical protein